VRSKALREAILPILQRNQHWTEEFILLSPLVGAIILDNTLNPILGISIAKEVQSLPDAEISKLSAVRNSMELGQQMLISIQIAEIFATGGQRHTNSCLKG
jgi:hypothetical protein